MAYSLRPAKRQNIHLLIGLAGGTGSGKTWTAMLLAKGMSGGKRFAVVDTENGRSEMYADYFDFDIVDLKAPFAPKCYEDAIAAAAAGGAEVIVVDQISHEWAGDGGCLDIQEADLSEFVKRALQRKGENREEWQIEEAQKMRSWIRPKLAHKSMVNKLLGVNAHVILLFRAESKIEMVKDPKTHKTVIQEKKSLVGINGWIPVSEKSLPFELTASFLLMQDQPGVPLPIKLQEQHKSLFPKDRTITEETGRLIAAWARGEQVAADVKPAANTPAPTPEKTTAAPNLEVIGRGAEKFLEDFMAELPAALKPKAQDLLAGWVKRVHGFERVGEIPKAQFESIRLDAINHARDLAVAHEEQAAMRTS